MARRIAREVSWRSLKGLRCAVVPVMNQCIDVLRKDTQEYNTLSIIQGYLPINKDDPQNDDAGMWSGGEGLRRVHCP
jgi:hypothetical protein